MTRYFYFLLLLLFFSAAAAQPPAPKFEHPGIKLYKDGKTAEALISLKAAVKQKEFRADGEIWNYLGLANLAAGDLKEGRKAMQTAVKLSPGNSGYYVNLAYAYLLLRDTNKGQAASEKAIKIDPRNVTAYYFRGSASLWELKLNDAERDADQILKIEPGYPQGYTLKSNVLVSRFGERVGKGSSVRDEIDFLRQARNILKAGVENCAKRFNCKLVEQEYEAVDLFYEHFSRDRSPISDTPSVPEADVTPMKVLSKPKPSYTDAARRAGVQGTIVVAVLFGSDGQIKSVLPLKRLGHGLDEQALYAARKIRFEPKMKNGKPVSTVRTVEYTFSIY